MADEPVKKDLKGNWTGALPEGRLLRATTLEGWGLPTCHEPSPHAGGRNTC